MSEKIDETTELVAKEATVVAAEKTNWARLHGSWKERIERMLPDPKMIDQFMYCAETQYGKDRAAFEKCSPVSLLSCMLTSAKYGILPDGRNAYLIPYGSECTLQFDYKGLVHVVLRDDVAKKVYADVICENDRFSWKNGKVEYHEVSLPRGKVVGAYCEITLSNGEKQYELMDIEDIETIMSCSRGSSSPSSPWKKFFKEMAKKTVFRRCTKWLKLSPDVLDAFRSDDEEYSFTNSNAEIRKDTKQLFARKAPEAIEAETVQPNKKQEEPEMAKVVVEKANAKKNLPF